MDASRAKTTRVELKEQDESSIINDEDNSGMIT